MDTNDITSAISGLSDAQPDPSAPASPMPNLSTPGTAPQAAPTQQQPATPAVSPNTPHAGLMSMLQGMMLGVSAFGKSIATQGREGGAEEVLSERRAQQEMKLKQDANTRAQQESAANITHLQALTNMQTAQLSVLQMKLPLELQKMQNDVFSSEVNAMKEAGFSPLEISMIEGQSTDEHLAGATKLANGDWVNNAAIPVHSNQGIGKGGTTYITPFQKMQQITLPSDKLSMMLRPLQMQLETASATGLGDRPEVKAAQNIVDSVAKQAADGGTMKLSDFHNLALRVMTPVSQATTQRDEINKFKTEQADLLAKQHAADPLYKLENDPSELAGEKSSAAISIAQGKINDPNTSPADKVRASRILAVAQSAHARYLQDQVQKANAEQQAKQGDPKAAGAMLASGDLTLTDMKTRGMTPDFIVKTINAAKAVDPKYSPADEMIAEAQAKSPTNVQFFGSANSLIAKGGTLDQVIEQGAKLPNYKWPIFNKVADAQNYAAGHPEVAGYMQTALAAADDYAKVVGGGTGTEGMQLKFLNAMTSSLNQDQRTAVVNSMRNGVYSQVQERIGKNKFMNRLYGYALPQNQAQSKPFDPATEAHPIQ